MDGNNSIFPTFHASKLKLHVTNNNNLLPNQDHPRPGPVLMSDGLEEHEIESIVDLRERGPGWQFLARWVGFGPVDGEWLDSQMLDNCEALDLSEALSTSRAHAANQSCFPITNSTFHPSEAFNS